MDPIEQEYIELITMMQQVKDRITNLGAQTMASRQPAAVVRPAGDLKGLMNAQLFLESAMLWLVNARPQE